MKPFNKVLLLSLITFHSLYCSTPATPNLNQTTHIHNHNNNSTIIKVCIDGKLIFNIKKSINNKYNNLKEWIRGNKWSVIGASAAVTYAFVLNRLANGKIILHNKNSWANWKNDISLTQLLDKNPSELCKELHQSILDKYANNNQSDLIAPVVKFVDDLEKEVSSLKIFCNISNKLNKIKISKIFLITENEMNQASEKVNRLLYIKNIVTDSIRVSLKNR